MKSWPRVKQQVMKESEVSPYTFGKTRLSSFKDGTPLIKAGAISSKMQQERPGPARRKSSFGDTLSKLAGKPFSRRRTNTIPASKSTQCLNSKTNIQVTTKLPRSTSLLSSISNRQPHSKIPQPSDEFVKTKTPEAKASRHTSHHLRKTPNVGPYSPIIESPRSSGKRDSDVQIQQRTLLKPVQPPMPKSQTYGDLSSTAGMLPPRFMRPTSSSAARQSGRVTRVQATDTPRKTADPETRRRGRKKISTASTFNEENSEIEGAGMEFADLTQGYSPPVSSKRMSKSSAVATNASSSGTKRRSLLFNSWKRLSGIGTAITTDDDDDYDPPPRIDMGFDVIDRASSSSDCILRSPGSGEVHSAQPQAYWLGRLTALSDRFRTEALEATERCHSSSTSFPSLSSSSSHSGSPASATSSISRPPARSSMHDNSLRMDRAWGHLRALCVTPEARFSLEDFKDMYEVRWTDAGERRPDLKGRGKWRFEKLGLGRKSFGG